MNDGHGQGQNFAKLIKMPGAARRAIVRMALEKLGEVSSPNDLIEGIEELQAVLADHVDAMRWVEKVFSRRLNVQAEALEASRLAHDDLTRRHNQLQEACSLAVRLLEEDELTEATKKLREAVDHVGAP